MRVRRVLHALGYRYRLHRKDLPGSPDIAFGSRRKVIFVHGCFWHAHGCSREKAPKSRLDYWMPKRQKNRERDKANENALRHMRWEVLTIWECEIGDQEALAKRLTNFLTA